MTITTISQATSVVPGVIGFFVTVITSKSANEIKSVHIPKLNHKTRLTDNKLFSIFQCRFILTFIG